MARYRVKIEYVIEIEAESHAIATMDALLKVPEATTNLTASAWSVKDKKPNDLKGTNMELSQ
jgi:hypothetical protein